MARKRLPFYEQLQMVSTGAAIETLCDESPSRGEKRVYTHIVAIDTLNAYTSLTMLAGGIGAEQEFDFVGNPQATERVEYDGQPVHVPEYQRMICQFAGTTAGDVLIVYMRGYAEVEDV